MKQICERAVITPSGGEDPPPHTLLNVLTDSCNLFSISGSACSISKEKGCVCVCVLRGVSATPPGVNVRTNLRGIILHALWQVAEGRRTLNLLDELICGPVMAPLTTLVIPLTPLCCDSMASPVVSLHYTVITFFYLYTVCFPSLSEICWRATAQVSKFIHQ